MTMHDPTTPEQVQQFNAGNTAYWRGVPINRTRPNWWRHGWYAARREQAQMGLLDVAEKRAAMRPIGAPEKRER